MATNGTPAAKMSSECVNIPSRWRYWAQNGENNFYKDGVETYRHSLGAVTDPVNLALR
jgi:hypothetical protein